MVPDGTYRARSTRKARLFLCRACGKAFSSRTGTAFLGLCIPKRTTLLGLRLLAEGLGLRDTPRVLEVKLDTVRGWLALAAQHCDHIQQELFGVGGDVHIMKLRPAHPRR
jgi:transposase-like protein